MGRFNWGPEGPPEDAYSRVTEPERFMLLHAWAIEAVALLNMSYEVTLDEGIGMDAELERRPLSRPTLKVAPFQDSCAPITIAFTDFPGLAVRFGSWAIDWFPSCGCDACDETPDSEIERLNRLLNDVVAGRFRESLRLERRFFWSRGEGQRTSEFWSADHRSSRGTRLSHDEASQILNGEAEAVMEWKPWQPKPGMWPHVS